jgi:hypothetical protein
LLFIMNIGGCERPADNSKLMRLNFETWEYEEVAVHSEVHQADLVVFNRQLCLVGSDYRLDIFDEHTRTFRTYPTFLKPVPKSLFRSFIHENSLFTFGGRTERFVYSELSELKLPAPRIRDQTQLTKDFGKMLGNGLFEDIELKCGPSTFKAHKFIICARSPLFRKIITNQEENTNDVSVNKLQQLVLTDVNPVDLQTLLEMLYSDEIQTITSRSSLECNHLFDVFLKYAPDLVRKLAQSMLKLDATIEHSRFAEDMFLCRTNWSNWFTDLELILHGQCFKIQRCVFASRSPYFRALLTSGLKETSMSKIELHDNISVDVFNLIRHFIYVGEIPHLSDEKKMALETLAALYEKSELYLLEDLRLITFEELKKRSKAHPDLIDIEM